jgi:uncharacterized protein (DUF58 family)
MGLAFGIGTAAYNSASNILFIALALLLSCLILSGVLAWLNLRGVDWALEISPPLRAGQEAGVGLRLDNRKAFLPTYALWFDFAARPVPLGEPPRPESTLTAKGIDVWAALRRSEEPEASGTVHMRSRLEPGGHAMLEWAFTPARRGLMRVDLVGVGSLFPFGFLRKFAGAGLRREVPVWPAPVEYRRLAGASPRRAEGDLRRARAGHEGEMIALRQYEPGDSHRLIHWKASARSRELLIRQFSAHNSEACTMVLSPDAEVWTRPEQFELLVSFAATLAQDLFRAGRLKATAIGGARPLPVRRAADVDSFLDRLAVVMPQPPADGPAGEADRPARAGQNVLTFEPEGARGVGAYANGHRIAAT